MLPVLGQHLGQLNRRPPWSDTVPAVAIPARPVPITPTSARRDDGGREHVPAASEIERFQYRFHSASWVFYVFVGTVGASLFAADSIDDWICAVTVEFAAFYPVLVWVRKGVLGMPIMPAFAMVALVYYALPFVTGHPGVMEYDLAEKWFAAATVAAVLVIMTIAWAAVSKPTVPHEREVRMLLPERGAIGILITCLVAGIAFQSQAIVYIIAPSSEVYGVMRAVFVTLGLLAIFSLSYLLGAGVLKGGPRYFFLALAILFIAYNAVTLYLIGAAQYLLAAGFGFFLGSGRLPWKLMVAVFSILVVLQAGKGEIRLKYSEDGEGAYRSIGPVELIQDWIGTGVRNLFEPTPLGDQEPVPLIQRTSLMHMLLKTQTEAPDRVDYLDGSTYYQIPLLLVPRVLWPDRPNTSETLMQLNEHYGLLTREEGERTSIGWGMIAEANANFGLAGCIGLAILLGIGLGLAQREFGRYPVLSARGMAGLLVMSTVTSMEVSMAQFLTILVQSFFPLMLMAWTIMRTSRVVV